MKLLTILLLVPLFLSSALAGEYCQRVQTGGGFYALVNEDGERISKEIIQKYKKDGKEITTRYKEVCEASLTVQKAKPKPKADQFKCEREHKQCIGKIGNSNSYRYSFCMPNECRPYYPNAMQLDPALAKVLKVVTESSTVQIPCPSGYTCQDDNQCFATCPSGFEYDLAAGVCVKDNPCNKILENSVPYRLDSSISEASTYTSWYDRTFDRVDLSLSPDQCKVPASDRTVFVRPIGRADDLAKLAPFKGIVPNISRVGCVFDGKVSKSLLKITAEPSDPTNTYATDVFLFCTDQSLKGSTKIQAFSELIGRLPSPNAGLADPEYLAVTSYPFCYKYKGFMGATYTSIYANPLPEFEVPYEDCSDCEPGLVKINGTCGCPEGMVKGPNGCEKSIGCKTTEDYLAGRCKCDNGLPYFSYDLMGYGSYTCKTPVYKDPKPDDNGYTRGTGATGNISPSGCKIIDGTPSYDYNVTISSSTKAVTSVYAWCTGETNDRHTSESPYLFDSLGTSEVGEGDTRTLKYRVRPTGRCYSYTFIAENRYTKEILWEQEVSITSYPHCQN